MLKCKTYKIAEDYTEMIAELINDTGEARVVDLAEDLELQVQR